MEQSSRHLCMIYDGAPSRHLPAVAAVACEKLKQGFRCLYLNSPPMVAGMRSYLAAAGVDVEREMGKSSLLLSSDQGHLANGHFDIKRMMDTLERTLSKALRDGYAGLWASGDMTWEMGPDKDYAKLLEYEWQLEQLFHTNAELSGICQYHVDTLPAEAVREGLASHRSLFVNETLSLANPSYLPPEAFKQTTRFEEMDSLIRGLCQADASAS